MHINKMNSNVAKPKFNFYLYIFEMSVMKESIIFFIFILFHKKNNIILINKKNVSKLRLLMNLFLESIKKLKYFFLFK